MYVVCVACSLFTYICGVPRQYGVDKHVDDEHDDDVIEGETALA